MRHPIENLRLRATIIQAIRDFFTSHDFLEVETPLRIPANAVEEHIEPQPADGWFLQTSPEMCMKRLLCRGHQRIFQISRCWRSGERGRLHCPEFTMLEWYRSNADYLDLMEDCERLLQWLATRLPGWVLQEQRERRFDLCGEAARITVGEAFERYAGITVHQALRDGTFDELMVTRVEAGLPADRPVFLMDYPAEAAALARLKPGDPACAERFELYLAGLELANGFSELNDQEEQRRRFIEANERRSASGHPPLPLPEPFLKELSTMPPAAGIALGIDRLVMLLAGADRIDEVLAFTPEEL